MTDPAPHNARPSYKGVSVAVLIPCYQEEKTIAKVVGDFRRELPEATIYVYDNNCTDETAERARAAGAVVRREKRQGKGFVVASMFEQVDADVLVMVDGDDTYDPRVVHQLIAPILRGDADTTVAGRQVVYEEGSFRKFHRLGNTLVCGIINKAFGVQLKDIFSGYRAFSREAALNIPITAHGFDVETELTLQALYRGMVMLEFQAPYGVRPEGSFSKLNTFSDGFRVLLKLLLILKSYKPLTLFGSGCLGLFVLALVAGARPVYEFLSEGFVYAVPSAILAAALMLLSFLFLGIGLILNSVNLRLLEVERLVAKRLTRLDRQGHGENG